MAGEYASSIAASRSVFVGSMGVYSAAARGAKVDVVLLAGVDSTFEEFLTDGMMY